MQTVQILLYTALVALVAGIIFVQLPNRR